MQDATCALIDSSLFVRIRSFPTSPHSNAVSFALCVAVAFTDRGLSPPLRFVRFHVSPSSSIPLGITLTTHYLRSYMSVTAHHTKRRTDSCSSLMTIPISGMVFSFTDWQRRSCRLHCRALPHRFPVCRCFHGRTLPLPASSSIQES